MQAKHVLLAAIVLILLIAILALSGLFPQAGNGTVSETPMPRMVAVDFWISNNTVRVVDTRMEYGYGPEYIRGTFRADVISTTGDVIYSIPIQDPRIRFGTSVVYVDNQDFTVVVPFRPEMDKLLLVNQETNEHLVSVQLGEEITRFCRLNNTDSECRKFLERKS